MVLSTLLQNRVVLFLYFRTTWTSIYLLASEPRGSPIYFRAAWSPPHLLWSRVVSPSLQSHMVSSFSMAAGPRFKSQFPSSFAAHFQLLLQSVTPASIRVFFRLYCSAIVSPGRCGPMAWSQSSPSSHAGPVTRGSCFPVPSWVEFAPIPLAQSVATAI